MIQSDIVTIHVFFSTYVHVGLLMWMIQTPSVQICLPCLYVWIFQCKSFCPTCMCVSKFFHLNLFGPLLYICSNKIDIHWMYLMVHFVWNGAFEVQIFLTVMFSNWGDNMLIVLVFMPAYGIVAFVHARVMAMCVCRVWNVAKSAMFLLQYCHCVITSFRCFQRHQLYGQK